MAKRPDKFKGMTFLSDDTVAVCVEEHKQYKLKRFSLETGRELGSARLTEAPCGMTEVQLGGRATVAVSYKSVSLTMCLFATSK